MSSIIHPPSPVSPTGSQGPGAHIIPQTSTPSHAPSMMLSPMTPALANRASSTSMALRRRGCCCCGRKKLELERKRAGVSEGCRRAVSLPAAERAGLGEGRGGAGAEEESGRRKPTTGLLWTLLVVMLRRLLRLLLRRRRRRQACVAEAVTAAAAAVRDGAQALQRRSTRTARRGLGRTLVVPTAEGMVGGPTAGLCLDWEVVGAWG